MTPIALTLLTLGLSPSSILCWSAEPNPDQAKAIAEVRNAGCRVTIDEKSPRKDVIEVVFDIADRISVLVYGEIIACDAPACIRGNKAVQEAYLGTEAH